MYKNPDLVMSLGPNCRNAWNVRDWFKFERAYPFDWWITPTKSMLKMIDPGFELAITREDLVVTQSSGPGIENSVFNRKLNILQHHDFVRNKDRQVEVINDADIEKLNSKYRHLFSRMHEDIHKAARPLFILNGLTNRLAAQLDKQALQPHGSAQIEFTETVDAIREYFGPKSCVLVIAAGEEEFEEYGNSVRLCIPDDGTRPKGGYAEPVNVFRRGFAKLELAAQLTPTLPNE